MAFAGPIVFSNFTFRRIEPGQFVLIPFNQQMVVYGGFILEGDLDLEGELIIL